MLKVHPRPNGEVQGDDTTMRDAGHKTGVTDTYGADISSGATNKIGSIKGDTKSDAMGECCGRCNDKGR